MKRLLLFLLLVPVMAFSQMKREQLTVKIDAAGHTAQALVYSPAGDDKSQQLPLLVWFHGAVQALYQNGQKTGKVDSDGLPNDINLGKVPCKCYVYVLQDDWSSPSPQAIDYSLKNAIEPIYPVDPTRIYALGLSYGGGAALAAAIAHAEYYSGVVSASPSALQDSSLKKISTLAANGIPVLFWYGTKDAGPFPGNALAYSKAITGAGGTSMIVTEAVGHGPWDNLFNGKTLYNGQTIYDVLFKYSKMPPVYVPPIVTAPPNKMLSVDTTNVLQIVIILKNGTIKSLLQ